jgi:hypothetical protein
VLSALLIIIAFLSILGGALLNEISGQFLLTQTLSNRIAAQATVNASVESSIGQLQSRSVPSRCSTDQGAGVAPAVTLNGSSATADIKCMAIVPDAITQLASGAFSQDGTHVTVGGRNTYLVGSGSTLLNFHFGQTAPMWQLGLGRSISGQPAQTPDPTNPGHFITAVPVGDRMALVDDYGWGASLRCITGQTGVVASQPGFEHPPARSSPFFPSYVFFGDSSGNLYAYDATRGSCSQLASVSGLGGPVVAGPLALTGEQNGDTCSVGGEADSTNTLTVDLFAVVNASGTGRLVHYQYCEATSSGGSRIQTIYPIESTSLGLRTPVGSGYSSMIPSTASPIRVVVTSQAGQLGTASILANNGDGGLTYSVSTGSVVTLAGSFNNAPYWCHCPGGDRIGAGNTRGTLYILDTQLAQLLTFDDGGVPINTTPAADSNGDWYFGADDGYIHDVEPPASGTVMFQAGLFGPVSPVTSSPVVGGTGDGCGGRVCIYFGAGNGSELAQIGDVRVLDLRARLTAGSGPSLWARIEVGNPTYVGGQGVHILSWSYFNP